MTTFRVTVPDDKAELFLQFMELIEGEAQPDSDNFELTDEMKTILDERLSEDTASYIPVKEAMQAIKEKYGL